MEKMRKTLLFLLMTIYSVCSFAQSIPIIRLKTSTYTPSTFTPSTYTPQQSDPSILQRSLEQLEQRRNNAQNAYNKLINLCAETAKQMPPSELEWFNQYCNSICNEVETQIEIGNTQSASNLAYKYMSNLHRDNNIQYRIDSYKHYCDDMQFRASNYENGRVTQAAYNWFCMTNQYTFSPKYDSSGKLEGYNPVHVSYLYPSINWNELGQFVTSRGQTKEDVERMWSLYFFDSENLRSLFQEFEVTKFYYDYFISYLDNPNLTQTEEEQLQSDIKRYRDILSDTDNQISYNAYVNNLKKQFIVQPTRTKPKTAPRKQYRKKSYTKTKSK